MLSSVLQVVLLHCFIAVHSIQSASYSCDQSASTHLEQRLQSPSFKNENMESGSDIGAMRTRRIEDILTVISPKDVEKWLSTLQEDGKWPDSEVDYTRGCQAVTANWPAQVHWTRTLAMAATSNDAQNVSHLQSAVSRAMDYWFRRDITNIACLNKGGTTQCPCLNISDSTLWNKNWYSNIILIPGLVSQVCLVMKDNLTIKQLAKCSEMTSRSFDFFYHTERPGFLAGANILDIARIGIDDGLLDNNITLLQDAYDQVHKEMRIHDKVMDDGIRPDGTFGQHSGVLYNGNYGQVSINLVLDIEYTALGTEFTAPQGSREPIESLLNATRWMIVRNVVTNVLHWDLSVVGRFISLPVIDNQATASIKLSLDRIKSIGNKWSSLPLIEFASSLNLDSSTASVGNVTGNRMFFASDYMVHRGSNYVSTLKMYSQRTKNTECINTQNPFGFHLSDGTLYTYIQGNEYEDISAVWNWNLIPGITVDYRATPLTCAKASSRGTEAFVGGVSDGFVGIAAMRFTNPLTTSFSWQKTWFFIDDDILHVMVNIISSSTDSQVFSVLDQRRHDQSGGIIVDGKDIPKVDIDVHANSSLWHGNVGYAFDDLGSGDDVLVRVEKKSGKWTTIGSSKQPPTSADIFTALIEHRNHSSPSSYTVFPGTTPESFGKKRSQLRIVTIQNDEHISAIFDEQHDTIFVTFWDPLGGTLTCYSSIFAPITMTSERNAVLIYELRSGTVILADPSQQLDSVNVVMNLGNGTKPPRWGDEHTKFFKFALPSNGAAGDSVSLTIS